MKGVGGVLGTAIQHPFSQYHTLVSQLAVHVHSMVLGYLTPVDHPSSTG